MTEYTEDLSTVAEALTNGDLGILIGAGMSKESGLDTAAELSAKMLKRALGGALDPASPSIEELARSHPFEAIIEMLREKLPYADVARWLREDGGFADAKPSSPHFRLADLFALNKNFPRIVFTTNFDLLIEDGFGDGTAIPITSENLHSLPEARQHGQVAVVHLHGAISHPTSLQVGEASLTAGDGAVWDLLRASLATDVFLLIGYSLTDANLKRVFYDVQRLATTRKGLQKRTFAVSPARGNPSNAQSESGMARKVWRQRGVDHIAMEAGSFLAALLETTKGHVEGKILVNVARTMGLEIDTLRDMLDSAAKPFRWITPFDLLLYLHYTLTPIKVQGTKP